VPFDVSGDAPDAWRPFADQVTWELIRNLRKISGLRVVPAPSAFTFKENKARDHIRRQLPDVQYVLDGVVSISADKSLRITAELEDLRKGLVVWDKEYEGRTDDTNLFSMQSRIAAAVSDSLKVAILADEQQALDEFPTSNLKAYEAYVAGRYQLDLVSHESLPRVTASREELERTDFLPFKLLADLPWAMTGHLLPTSNPPVNMLRVVDSIAEAQELRPDSAEACLPRADLCDGLALKDAWIALNKAKRRDPTLAQTELGFALYYCALGEPDKVSSRSRSRTADPLNAEMPTGGLGAIHGGRRQADRVDERCSSTHWGVYASGGDRR
jgi:TolB-like protein